jgi:uroporphyrinogen-III decarboxylase
VDRRARCRCTRVGERGAGGRSLDRGFYLDLARSGARFPIGTHLVLHEKPDPEALRLDGIGLGRVVEEAARRYGTPLAFPLMDLTVEKADLGAMLGIPEGEVGAWHFPGCPNDDVIERVEDLLDGPPTAHMKAGAEAIRYVAQRTGLVPVGMAIGPFSLMTKLLADPITPVFLAGSGMRGTEDADVRTVEIVLELATRVVQRGIRLQVEAGARAVCVCEPAVNRAYLSPRQIAKGSDVFERLVMVPHRRIRGTLAAGGADLILHDCGELVDAMIIELVTLDPVILSLGSSRSLWEDARLVPPTTVLYGNLPTRSFYSDAELPIERVEELTRNLVGLMRRAGHPHILGSECDVLSVPGCERTIREKVERMLTCGG